MITREQAEAALAVVKTRYATYDDADEITLILDYDERTPYMICWESGPYDWAHRANEGGLNEEIANELAHMDGVTPVILRRIATEKGIKFPPGVHVEPYFSYALGVWEA